MHYFHQTEEQRVASQRMQRKRKTLLEARLAKVCERRNIDKSVVQTYTNSEGIFQIENKFFLYICRCRRNLKHFY